MAVEYQLKVSAASASAGVHSALRAWHTALVLSLANVIHAE